MIWFRAKRIAEAGDLNDVCVMGWDSMCVWELSLFSLAIQEI